jgi:hypothetical protein
MTKFRRYVVPFLVTLCLTSSAFAAEKKAPAESNSNVLNFEADLIEGERKRPDLFLQIGSQKLSLDAILYRRNDFNDFHKDDKNRRPAYLLVKPKTKR